MAKKSTPSNRWLQTNTVRVTRTHFFLVGFYLLSVIIFDSWNLYTHQATSQLWTAGGVLLTCIVLLWLVARMKFKNYWIYVAITLALVVVDMLFASYIIWWQHGLASKAVILYAVPIVTAATLRSRSILLAVTTLSAVLYSTTSVRYFYQNYGFSYRVELYGTIGFYSAVMFVLAWLLLIIIRPSEEKF